MLSRKQVRAGAMATVWACYVATTGWAQTIVLPQGAVIVAEGDSLTYGQDTSPTGIGAPINGATAKRSGAPYPETLQELLGCGRVVNHGYPGDQSGDGLARWQHDAGGDVVVLMYGSNDALNYGRSPRGIVAPQAFGETLAALVARRTARPGTRAIILAPPPLQDRAADRRLVPYRDAAKAVAGATGSAFVDTVALLKPLANPWTDGVHLSAEANRAIGTHLATMIACAKEER